MRVMRAAAITVQASTTSMSKIEFRGIRPAASSMANIRIDAPSRYFIGARRMKQTTPAT